MTVALFFVVLLLTVLLFPFDKKKKITHAQCFWWADSLIRLNPYWHIEVEGLENIDAGQTYVVIANHQSMADIVVLYKTMMQFKWVAKESLFRVPFIGWCLGLIRHIRLRRGDYSSIKRVWREAGIWLNKGMSVLFFPEGTRSGTEEMNDFQNGAFKLAIKEKKPVLPICIAGTHRAMPKGGWVFNTRVSAKVTVLPAVKTEELSPVDFAGLRDMVRRQIVSCLR